MKSRVANTCHHVGDAFNFLYYKLMAFILAHLRLSDSRRKALKLLAIWLIGIGLPFMTFVNSFRVFFRAITDHWLFKMIFSEQPGIVIGKPVPLSACCFIISSHIFVTMVSRSKR